jgi:hypothetical protein
MVVNQLEVSFNHPPGNAQNTARSVFTRRRNDATKNLMLTLTLKRCGVASSREARTLFFHLVFSSGGVGVASLVSWRLGGQLDFPHISVYITIYRLRNLRQFDH